MEILDTSRMKGGEDATQFEGFKYGAGASFFAAEINPGDGPDKHRHPSEETFTILKGQIEFVEEGQSRMISAGAIVVVPPGMWHEFRN
jgi:quercetin dioxygenase-like cupin family protein